MKRLVIFLLFLLLPAFGEAKRIAPPTVNPLIYKGVKFVAPASRMGYVEAWDIQSGKKVWEKKVYSVFINPLMEADVQWVFIASLSIENGKLLVVDERGRRYKVSIPRKILKE
jgi:hypothetical protein